MKYGIIRIGLRFCAHGLFKNLLQRIPYLLINFIGQQARRKQRQAPRDPLVKRW